MASCDADKVIIKDLATECRIGVFEWEQKTPQQVWIDVELAIDAAKVAASDDLKDVVDYGRLVTRLKQHAQQKPFKLLETLAEELAALILKEFAAPQVTLCVKKRALPGVDYTAVELSRPFMAHRGIVASDPNSQCKLCLQYVPCGARVCWSCGQFLHWRRRFFHKYAVPFIAAFCAGALLFLWGQHTERRLRIAEKAGYNDRLIRSMKIELSQNWANINNIRSILKQDLKNLEGGQITITPLLSFRFDAWRQAQHGPAKLLEDTDTKDLMKLTYCYSVLEILQDKIHDREQYRLLRESSPGFVERMKKLDQNILEKLDHAQKLIEVAQSYLYSIHDWVVTGESFSVEAGLVLEPEEHSSIDKK